MHLKIETESWPYKVPFRVSRGAEEALGVVVVTLTDAGGRVGRGEAAGVDYDGETLESMCAQIESSRSAIETGVDAAGLAAILPAGGARNAVDCALWDLEAKRAGKRVWELAGLAAPRGLTTAITLGIDTDAAVTAGASRHSHWPLIKVKVDGARHIDVVRRVHAAAPGARLIVDPNQAWSCELLNALAPELARQGVVLIEQPVPRGEDASLRDYRGEIRLAADESVDEREALAEVAELYQVVNVKLDKTGGLTEALALAREARERGLGVMVGCMAGTSLAMAPGMVVAQLAEFVDLDGPLLHAADRPHGIRYDRGRMELPSAALWG
ncbi:MAG TPA: N-acetyl-D-Glu racemase DgcA [Steroidobacteraceae bacterium]|jgi:L-alanine-DL-glutamate epimerase-like enolase superfamily enzyme|nr:N-acetyl-D-Glu racemase DgcA [Steroidobacteraceae bacterium]